MWVEERGRDAVWLDDRDYERFREAAATYRERLLVRLGGEVGLRPFEVVQSRPAHVSQFVTAEGTSYFLHVPHGKDAGDGGAPREAYLPTGVRRELQRYVRSNGIAEDQRIIDVTPRRVEMLLADVGGRAAEETGEPAFREVSANDLRRYFAHHLLVEEGVNPLVVMSVGGWKHLESLAPYFDRPDRTVIAEAFRETTFGSGPTGDARRHDQPPPHVERLAQVAASVFPLGDLLAGSSTHAELREGICERLAESAAYRFAWIGEATEGGRVEPLTWAGLNEEALDELVTAHRTDDAGAPSIDAAARTRRSQFAPDVDADARFERLAEEAAERGFRSFAAVPLAFGDTCYGVLAVYADHHAALEERERALLADLGVQVGHAMTAIEWEKLLLADSVVQLEFTVADRRSPFVAAAAELDAALRLDGLVPERDNSLRCFLSVTGATPAAALDVAASRSEFTDARVVREYGDGALVELVLTERSPVTTLVEHGGTITELLAEEGQERLVCEFSPETDLRQVVDDLKRAFPPVELVAKREVERAARTPTLLRATLEDRLTDKQLSVLQTAYLAGYFEWPRATTAEELAASIGISSPTLHNHLRKAEQKLLTTFFEEGGPDGQ